VLARVARSSSSVKAYGPNTRVLLRPDASIVVVQTAKSFLFTYSIDFSAHGRVYQQHTDQSQARRQSLARQYGVDESAGLREVNVRFRRAIRIDAGIHAALALDDELLVSTAKPPAVQCIRWLPDETGSQTSAQLLSKMDWIRKRSSITKMVYDRAMNLSVWVALDGRAYAVQRVRHRQSRSSSSEESVEQVKPIPTNHKLFQGYCFHEPISEGLEAVGAAINAKFSLLAISCMNGEIHVYAAKDYAGNIPLSHKMPMPGSFAATGRITCLAWSPDGYCLFAGFEKGWASWSVFGKQGASSLTANHSMADVNQETWLLGISTANWTSGGSEILLTSRNDDRIWTLGWSRSAAVGCFACSNFVRALLQTPSEVIIYRGHDMPDLTSISNEASLWLHAPFPQPYMHGQWPIKSCVISQDGRYVAIAGRRGLAHYSVQSGRWKTFANPVAENSFAVRGGMAWFGHVLIAATESEGSYELRLYSRDHDLGSSSALHIEPLPAAVVFIGPSGEESLLVYTHENVLYHYVINMTQRGANLVPVGQIAFHGVVRAPTRVRSVSWVLPDSQLRSGDPSRDVEFASVLFLVDDKLVLLQPSRTAEGALKYDMRIIAQHVEYYILMRDQVYFNFSTLDESAPPTPPAGMSLDSNRAQHLMRDSLWTFGGYDLRVWEDVREILRTPSEEFPARRDMLSIPVDFYPLSILLTKGIILGIEAELLQRRDVNFATLRSVIRTHLFIPYILRHQICDESDIASALALAQQFEHLSYFPHALEILLHNVLDDEAGRDHGRPGNDNGEGIASRSMLPTVLSFLQTALSPESYLSTIVQCVRKTEISSWHTLFAHLPTPVALFEQALQLDDLKTASGYLIVLQGLEEEENDSDTRMLEDHVVRLMKLARRQNDFELCAELARFMIALDPRGEALRRVIEQVGFRGEVTKDRKSPSKVVVGLGLQIPSEAVGIESDEGTAPLGQPVISQPKSARSSGDYFSASPGETRSP
jgi:WD40 repeat protein